MIYEYAVDPSLAAEWGDLAIGNLFLGGFCETNTRLISKCPKKWRGEVWTAVKAKLEVLPSNHRDEYLGRVTEVMSQMLGRQVTRNGLQWNGAKGWLENVLSEHQRTPFRAIISLDGSGNIEECLSPEDCNILNPHWKAPSSQSIPRDENEIGKLLSPFLCRAKRIILVDPYLATDVKANSDALLSILNHVFLERPNGIEDPPQISLYLSSGPLGTGWDYHIGGIRKFVLPKLSSQTEFKVVLLAPKEGALRLHNRYVLTDLGGVQLGEGLSTKDGVEDDVQVLSPDHYARRWRQYNPDTLEFIIERETLLP